MAPPAASRLQSHRRKSGLTQRELAGIIGVANDVQIFRHESGVSIPPLTVALAYSILFQVPISEIFPSLYEAVSENIEATLTEFEQRLQQSSTKGLEAIPIAQKLEWISGRKNHTELA